MTNMLHHDLPGIDKNRGLASVRGNDELYEKLLYKFHDQCLDAVTQLPQLLRQGHSQAAMRLVHSVKGVAGSLGAQRLFETGQQLEARLAIADPDVAPVVAAFDAELATVVQGLNAARRAEG